MSAAAGGASHLSYATHVRSALILSSVQTLRARGHFDAYLSHLPGATSESILGSTASAWFAMDIAMAHYRACDALGLTINEQIALGGAVGDRVQGTFLGLLLRGARGLGASPWIPLSQMGRIWNRVFMGGGGAVVVKLGPKDATCRFVGLPIVDVPYLRNAWRGAFIAGMQPFCAKAYAVEVLSARRSASALYRLSWA